MQLSWQNSESNYVEYLLGTCLWRYMGKKPLMESYSGIVGHFPPLKKKKISISSRFPATFDPSDPRGKIAMENSAI